MSWVMVAGKGFLSSIKHLAIGLNMAATRWILDEDHEDRGKYPMSLPPRTGVNQSVISRRLPKPYTSEAAPQTFDA